MTHEAPIYSLDRSTTPALQRVMWITAGIAMAIIGSVVMTHAWSASAAPDADEATYVATNNCRLLDTRSGELPAGERKSPIGPGEAHAQQVTGAVGDCNVPSEAVAVAMNVTVTNGTAQSNLRVFPGDESVPNASNLNWTAGQSPTPNKVDVKLSPTGGINIYNHNGTVDVVADVVGFYVAGELKELSNAVEMLFGARSFSVSSPPTPVGVSPINPATSVASVNVTAPADGHVTLNSQAYISGAGAGETVTCSIGTSANTTTAGYRQVFERTFGGDGSLAGTARFPIDADQTVTYHLVCDGSGVADVGDRLLTGVFTPAVD